MKQNTQQASLFEVLTECDQGISEALTHVALFIFG